MRGALTVFNALYPALVSDWFDSALRSQDAARDRHGQVTSFAELLRVREANGGGCWAEHGCRARLRRSAACPCHAGPCVSGRSIAVGYTAGEREPLADSGRVRLARFSEVQFHKSFTTSGLVVAEPVVATVATASVFEAAPDPELGAWGDER